MLFTVMPTHKGPSTVISLLENEYKLEGDHKVLQVIASISTTETPLAHREAIIETVPKTIDSVARFSN